jgi:prepilin-type N-terminal cleavage/methylation domain-containing protein
MSRNTITKEKKGGFTLIEMLVSVALFTVVLTVTLGAILTIIDANRKARSLMSVMGNLNFAVDSITRSVKTGTNISVTSGGNCVSVDQIDYNGTDLDGIERATYCLDGSTLTKRIESGTPLPLTSPDVDIDYLKFTEAGTAVGEQPRLGIRMEGTVRVSPRVSSSFTIQTSVSQRQLNL